MGMRLSAAVLSVELSSLSPCDALQFLSHLDIVVRKGVPARFPPTGLADLCATKVNASNRLVFAIAISKDF